MKVFKKLVVLTLALIMIAGLFPVRSAQAATKPAKAKVTAKANDDGTSVTLTIAKTKNAEGFKIMVKKPGAKKFTALITLKEDGTAKRTYTAEELTEGEYQFKVRAYLKNGKKTVWGKYSKVVKVKIAAKDSGKDDKDSAENSDFSKAKTGDIIVFGSYEQDDYTENGKEAIEWLVLSNDGKELLVVSKYALDGQPYSLVWNHTWEESTIRKWLNDDFYNAAFSASDKKLIKTTKLKNNDNPVYGTEYGSKGGNDTMDNVFLLSLEDIVDTQYGFSSDYEEQDIARLCEATAYAHAQGVWENYQPSIGSRCHWWLRSPGRGAGSAAIVNINGVAYAWGVFVQAGPLGVRPALIINLNP